VSVTLTQSDSAPLDEVRAGVLRQPGLVGVRLRDALSDAYDGWLRSLLSSLPQAGEGAGGLDGIALVAVGGLGRREPAPYSDLDLVLLHNKSNRNIRALADSIWYPIWDSGVGLDHSVRTADEAVSVAKDDLKALLGLLELRHIAGDLSVSGPVRERVFELWRATAPKRVGELRELTQVRWDAAGEAAFLLEPNLKDSRGGLRDAQTLSALAAAQLVDVPVPVRAARTTLLDIRGELQRQTGRGDDVLRQQEQENLAIPLGLAEADDVLREVNVAARTVALALTSAWRRVDANRRPSRGLLPRLLGSFSSSPAPAARVGLAKDVVAQDGEVVLARDADPWADPLLVLRAARVAAEQDLPLAPFALERLASEGAPIPIPWPQAALDEFVSLLGRGAPAVPVLESLDQAGLLSKLIPEWDSVRFKIQHNPVHRFTVDRHLLETAAHAAALTRQVSRPDLLLIGALLHDIGKGDQSGDHSITGAVIAERIANRMGLSYGDAATVTALVRHHLLLPDTATRRDLDDPVTVETVAEAVAGSAELLDLLHALTVADAAATGPLVWSEWKAGLIKDLVRKTRARLAGAQQPAAVPLDDRRRQMAEAGVLAVVIEGDEVIVAAPDALGVLSRTAGVLALHSLDVRAASIHTQAGMAVNAFVVEPRFGELPEASIVRNDLARAMAGTLALSDRLSAKERSYAHGSVSARKPSTVHWFDDAATDATVLELRAEDAIGLLYRLTSALERLNIDIRSARVSSLGGSVVDAFYVTTNDGMPIPQEARSDIEAALVVI
jgi:[protein-PII] uridylyltransferase